MTSGCSFYHIFFLSSSLEGHENCEYAVDKPKFPGAAAVCAWCVRVCGWMHECVHADGPLQQQQQFIFYQSGLISHNMSGQSIPKSPLLLQALSRDVTAVSSVDNMAYQSRPHQSVFMKTWLTPSVSIDESVNLSRNSPILYGTIADRWATAVMTWCTAALLSPEWIPSKKLLTSK